MEKIAVVAPIPKASIRTAVSAKPNDLLNWRRENFRSNKSLCMEILRSGYNGSSISFPARVEPNHKANKRLKESYLHMGIRIARRSKMAVCVRLRTAALRCFPHAETQST